MTREYLHLPLSRSSRLTQKPGTRASFCLLLLPLIYFPTLSLPLIMIINIAIQVHAEGSSVLDRICSSCSIGSEYSVTPNAPACMTLTDCPPGTYVRNEIRDARSDRKCKQHAPQWRCKFRLCLPRRHASVDNDFHTRCPTPDNSVSAMVALEFLTQRHCLRAVTGSPCPSGMFSSLANRDCQPWRECEYVYCTASLVSPPPRLCLFVLVY